MRQIHNLIQGSPEWRAYRAMHFNASDAPAMMGVSSYKTRDALLKQLATGIAEEVSEGTQKIFDAGHQFEAVARPIAEKIVGEDLFPSTVSLVVDGLPLSASLDGWTMDEEKLFEHKTLNKVLDDAFKTSVLPLEYKIQMEQQLLVSGANICLFAASKGTENTFYHTWYVSDPDLRAQIIAGWKQFKIDLENYKAAEPEQPKAIAAPVEVLPAITYKTTFEQTGITLRSNLDLFKEKAQKLVEQSKTVLETDQDFANAEARVKACEAAEKKIKSIQEQVIGEVTDIDQFHKELGAVGELLRQCRLADEKQVKSRKESIKIELMQGAQDQLLAHINEIDSYLTSYGVRLPQYSAKFADAIKGLKTISSLKSKLNDAVASAKIEINQTTSLIKSNLDLFDSMAGDYGFLFADKQQLVVREADYVKLVIEGRIADQKRAEQEKIQKANDAATVEAPIELLSEISNSAARIVSTTREFVEQNQVQDDEHQRGLIEGLELSLKLFEKYGPHNFEKSVRNFIEVGQDNGLVEAA